MSVEEKSLRETIEASFPKETPAEPAKETTPPAVESPPNTEVKKDDLVSDTSDKSTPVPGEPGKTDDSGKSSLDSKDSADKPQPPSDVAAPASLKAAERAEWAKAPKAIQEAFVRREAEVQTALRQSAESRKLAEEFNQIAGPYMPLIRAQQSTPMVAFKNLLTTAAGLTLGSPEQKAAIIRDIINNYRVDIEVLDKVLAGSYQGGQKPQALPGTSEIEVHVQKAVAPIYQFMEGLTARQQEAQQRMQADAERAVESFRAKNEFFDDVRDDVANLMEAAANGGRELNMQQAYTLALEMPHNSNIKTAIAQKKAAAGNSEAEKARRASMSVTGVPTGARPRDPNANSLRDDLMAAFQQAEGG